MTDATPVIDVTDDENDLHERVGRGGTVVLPAKRVELTRPLVVNTVGTTLVGDGVERTTLAWKPGHEQPGPLLDLRAGSFWFRLQGFNLQGPAADRQIPGLHPGPWDEGGGVGLGIGCAPAPDGGFGSMSGTGVVSQVQVGRFAVGVQVGLERDAVCASEILFDLLKVAHCRDAVRVEGRGNSLNLRFRMLGLTDCWEGVYVLSGGSVTIESGSATNVGYWRGPLGYQSGAVFTTHSAGVFSIRDFRSEHSPSGRLLNSHHLQAASVLRVEGCETVGGSRGVGASKPKERFAVYAGGNASLVVESVLAMDTGLILWQGKGEPHLKKGDVTCRNNRYLKGCLLFSNNAGTGDPKRSTFGNREIDASGVVVG